MNNRRNPLELVVLLLAVVVLGVVLIQALKRLPSRAEVDALEGRIDEIEKAGPSRAVRILYLDPESGQWLWLQVDPDGSTSTWAAKPGEIPTGK